MVDFRPSSSRSSAIQANVRTEFDILKASHKFLREEVDETSLSWEEKVAKKYYDNLYREFAVCDLKHYKSGNFALRWRTETEVLSGAGETTCGNIRCPYHDAAGSDVRLKTLEVPFGYEEHGAYKSCLVKLVLCARCTKKLMWKKEKEKEKRLAGDAEHLHLDDVPGVAGTEISRRVPPSGGETASPIAGEQRLSGRDSVEERRVRSRRSRSRSPKTRRPPGKSERRRSRSR
ncbi:hypothetical protein GLOTRDRAFT_78146 [Gloeophyllum trabeum ATCC 11539]|uniref:Protein FRA10AC1 n=1 Tax=Gloeophyllum trabeum (strain ATCC 11539 / FP-39264 / Madison 617) TaxID=670483 RepID=S7RN81_GLOTA|nr:uncharacterized protein GLOTRDRAFT_78146 [Gloeophyllum trabeum ATCC 11539]EPQ54214.1 hypothetical protein GLOTRDRAFT_78146 [Gloeophyllum trabeum ATCC 11539]